jgi:N-acetylmuramic acid 6-phosphate etherase
MDNVFEEISLLDTEAIEPEFANVDLMETDEILTLINQQDQLVANAVNVEIPYITKAVEVIVNAFKNGGRLIYVGAGTSGRLGVLDAAECPPTFSTDPYMVQGIIAGGKQAMFSAIEGAEDNVEDGKQQINKLNITHNDVVCGITACGRTPWVLAALTQAKQNGASTIMLSTNKREHLQQKGITADVMICPNVGPEIIAGSTRMKSATAQKMVLNMLTTATMIRMGKTYQNIMVDLNPLNEKLRQRAKRIIMLLTGLDEVDAEHLLINTNYDVKLALVFCFSDAYLDTAKELTKDPNFKVREIIRQVGEHIHK